MNNNPETPNPETDTPKISIAAVAAGIEAAIETPVVDGPKVFPVSPAEYKYKRDRRVKNTRQKNARKASRRN